MKTPEKLPALKEEVEDLSKKLAELTEDELPQIVGGVGHANDIDPSDPRRQEMGRRAGGIYAEIVISETPLVENRKKAEYEMATVYGMLLGISPVGYSMQEIYTYLTRAEMKSCICGVETGDKSGWGRRAVNDYMQLCGDMQMLLRA